MPTSASYVNAGTLAGGGIGSSSSPALPASLVTGNLLISYCYVSGGAVNFSVDAAWTIGGHLNAGSGSDCAWAWRIVDGTDASPNWTFDFTQFWSQVIQIQDNSATPIGSQTSGQGSSTTLSVGALNTTANNSLVLALLFTGASSQTIPTPTGFTARNTDATSSHLVADEVVATAGNASDAVAVTISSAAWAGFLIEILFDDPIKVASAQLPANSTLTANARLVGRATATFAAAGSLRANLTVTTAGALATLIGVGSLSANLSLISSANTISALLAGVGGMRANAIVHSGTPPAGTVVITWSNRNRITEDSNPLAWDAATVTPEVGQTTNVYVLGPTKAVLNSHTGLTGTSYTLDLSEFGAIDYGYIRVTSSRDGLESIQGYEIVVQFQDVGALSIASSLGGISPPRTRNWFDSYSETFTASGGIPPYRYEIDGALPPGMTTIEQDGLGALSLNGNPSAPGTYPSINIHVTDAAGDTATFGPFVIIVVQT